MPRSVERRRFPPPWSIDEANNACFIVRDSTGQALAYFYFEEARPWVVFLSLNLAALAVVCTAVYYGRMTKTVPQRRIYKAALAHLSGPRFHPYLGVDIEAASDAEAADKAMEWALKNAREVLPQTWLQVTLEGRGVHSEKLEWNNA
jgi:hypothetical protein